MSTRFYDCVCGLIVCVTQKKGGGIGVKLTGDLAKVGPEVQGKVGGAGGQGRHVQEVH